MLIVARHKGETIPVLVPGKETPGVMIGVREIMFHYFLGPTVRLRADRVLVFYAN